MNVHHNYIISTYLVLGKILHYYYYMLYNEEPKTKNYNILN